MLERPSDRGVKQQIKEKELKSKMMQQQFSGHSPINIQKKYFLIGIILLLTKGLSKIKLNVENGLEDLNDLLLLRLPCCI